MKYRLLKKMGRFGVLSRSAAKNDLQDLRKLVRQGLVRKVRRKGCVFYEATEKALPLLESYRKLLFSQAELQRFVTPNAKLYQALLGDLRFLDEQHPLAEEFQFLSDWQLKRPVVPGQLQLSQERFYHTQGIES